MADTYFVGKINTQSTAAVGIVFSVMSIIQAVGFFFGHGSGNYISAETRCAGDWECREDGGYRFLLGVVYGHISGSGGTYLPYPVVACIGFYTYYPALYGEISGHHIAGCTFHDGFISTEQSDSFQGNAAYAMVGIVSGAVINVILDPILIFVFDMGISVLRWLQSSVRYVVSPCCCICAERGQYPYPFQELHTFTGFHKGNYWWWYSFACPSGLASVATILLNVAAGLMEMRLLRACLLLPVLQCSLMLS